jgi:hypothetical protein
LWGLALGAWFLAPAVVDEHHIRTEHGTQWLLS